MADREFMQGHLSSVPYRMTEEWERAEKTRQTAAAHYRQFVGVDLGAGARVDASALTLVDRYGNTLCDLPATSLSSVDELRQMVLDAYDAFCGEE